MICSAVYNVYTFMHLLDFAFAMFYQLSFGKIFEIA